ncbi:MAG: hypothetical protein GTO45_06215 [Candidatus Aminicenantes bacterium]|nr:hypothetical protein [Candidatus Aminicenantes bacterium]NIM78418.1 hypothetical protein [Candidatus Aminicenantes bacterium]NIN17680.1 hypothetical protein [Candidatus Aminicenantes bacterium]NIN41556.1 hypothetical protein [Candidatus Aminicenantes bacterium]NIN84330.1 hypothetical protein [Candidatus Aminicenantes bacterium]
MNRYQSIIEDIKIFQKSEMEKVKYYLKYDHYGGYGIRLTCIPPEFGIIDGNSFNITISNVNTGERLNIYYPAKGKYYFYKKEGYMDVEGIILLLGGLISFIVGYRTTNNQDYLKFIGIFSSHFKSLLILFLARIILLNSVALILISISFLLPLAESINLFNVSFLYFGLVIVVVFSLFSSVGAIIGSLKRRNKPIILAVMYFVFVLFFPWLGEKYNQNDAANIRSLFDFEQEARKLLMIAERKMFERFGTFKGGPVSPDIKKALNDVLENEFKRIFEHEEDRKNVIKSKIKTYQLLTAILPSSFFQTVRTEICGGGMIFIDFYTFCQKRKYEFIKFFFKKQFYEKSTPGKDKIESFIKGNENIFHAKSRLPHGFCLGIGLTILYTIGAFFIAYRLHLKSLRREESKGIDIKIGFEKDKNTAFVLCKTSQVKDEIFRHYQGQKNAVCIDKINPEDFKFNGIKPGDLLKHLSRVVGVDLKRALENLGIMGVDIDIAKCTHKSVFKIYVAVMAAVDWQLIVINDFFKRESRQLERDCFKLLSSLIAAGKKIIYLSTEMYQTTEDLDEKIKAKINEYGVFSIKDEHFEQITLR